MENKQWWFQIITINAFSSSLSSFDFFAACAPEAESAFLFFLQQMPLNILQVILSLLLHWLNSDIILANCANTAPTWSSWPATYEVCRAIISHSVTLWTGWLWLTNFVTRSGIYHCQSIISGRLTVAFRVVTSFGISYCKTWKNNKNSNSNPNFNIDKWPLSVWQNASTPDCVTQIFRVWFTVLRN